VSDLAAPFRAELERLAPAGEIPASDWALVERGARRRSGRVRLALVAAILVAAIAVPTLALSASVRGLLGFGNYVSPRYAEARLAVSTPIAGGRVARLWVAPSTKGGECEFVTLDPAGAVRQPTQMTGGGVCTLGAHPVLGTLNWSFSHGKQPLLSGRASKAHTAGVKLQWHGGSQQLTYANKHFIAVAPALHDPPFGRLPFDLVAVDRAGRAVGRSRIPTSFLYDNWKQVAPQLHVYRVTHGCELTVLWRCKSR
jgi:hypothetical protein